MQGGTATTWHQRPERFAKIKKVCVHWSSAVRMQTYNCGKDNEYFPEVGLALDYCDRRDIVFDVPPMLFPSLQLKFQHGRDEDPGMEQFNPPHRLTTNSSLLLAKREFAYSELVPAVPVNTIAPTVPAPVLQKRPVGRPRLHPKKVIDPNRVKRGKIKSIWCTCFKLYPI